MSMFRSAADISSSDSSSDESESSPVAIGGRATLTSQERNPADASPTAETEHGSRADTTEDVLPDSKESLGADAEGHANMMTASLLEFYCLTRAAEILNAQQGSHGKFTRDSPEVKYLGKKLYTYKSQLLSSHGIVPSGIEREELGPAREYYRENLDLLGLKALEDLNVKNTSKGRSPPIRAGSGELALLSKSSAGGELMAGRENAGPRRPGLQRNESWGLRKLLPSSDNLAALQDVQLDIGSLRSPALPLFSSSPVTFPLLDAHSMQHGNRMSRYAVEFSEVKILGRGSFGEVYHVKNHIDGQNYAVKKIPLSERRLQQLQFGGQNQLETIMKEIRTLARLEHTNIVRYYGAWVEQVHTTSRLLSHQLSQREPSDGQPHDSKSSHESLDEGLDEQSFGIVFEHSESSMPEEQPESASEESDENPFHQKHRRYSQGTLASSYRSKKSLGTSLEDDVESIPRNFSLPSYGPMSTIGGTDDDIFTDGLSQDQSKLQIQRRYPVGSQAPAVILHIQMSLHPISLNSYLNPQASLKREDDDGVPSRRHCFHLVPSLRLILNIISGVEYLHSKKIVHRDLKPANIFLSPPEGNDVKPCLTCESKGGIGARYCHPRIGDFGLVADISHLNDSPSNGPHSSRNEGPNITRVVGTEFYRPPLNQDGLQLSSGLGQSAERRNQYIIDEKLDIYALGVILFELLYRLNTKMERQLVLAELTRGEKGPSMSTGQVTFPTDFADKVDLGQMRLDGGPSIAEILMTCLRGMLEPDSELRWSCQDVKESLTPLLAAAERVDSSSHEF